MSKLQQESLIRKEGLQFGFDNRTELQKACYPTKAELEYIKKVWNKVLEQARKGEHGLLHRNVEQQNKSRLRRMWEAVTQLFPNIHLALLAERSLSKIANRQ